jgi:site-specific DNA recombinase
MKKYGKRLKAVMYYRISKRVKNNVRMQRKICKEYCLKQKIGIVKEYVDKGVSGVTVNRPALKRLLKDIEGKKFNCVIVYKIDRLGRNFSHLNDLIKDFNERGIRLISATQDFDNSTPEGKFMQRMLIILAEFESKMISKRTIDGLRASKKV